MFYVPQDDLEVITLLSLSAKYYNFRHAPVLSYNKFHEPKGMYFLHYGKVLHGVRSKATTVTMQVTDEHKFYDCRNGLPV